MTFIHRTAMEKLLAGWWETGGIVFVTSDPLETFLSRGFCNVQIPTDSKQPVLFKFDETFVFKALETVLGTAHEIAIRQHVSMMKPTSVASESGSSTGYHLESLVAIALRGFDGLKVSELPFIKALPVLPDRSVPGWCMTSTVRANAIGTAETWKLGGGDMEFFEKDISFRCGKDRKSVV